MHAALLNPREFIMQKAKQSICISSLVANSALVSTLGCAPLRPDWLSSSPQRYCAGAYQLDGDWCFEYCTPGSEAASDCWAFRDDAAATPCAYREAFQFPAPGPGAITHNLTMVRGSFVAQRPPPAAFALPAGREQQCAQPCPRVFGQTCG